jgi:hypothetical protein
MTRPEAVAAARKEPVRPGNPPPKERGKGSRLDLASFARSLLADPLRKLLALALAIPLWIFLDSQVTKQVVVLLSLRPERQGVAGSAGASLELRLGNEPYTVRGFRDAVTEQEVNHVRIVFAGAKHVVETLQDDPVAYVRVTPGSVNPQTDLFEFDKNDIRSDDPNLRNALQEMTPRRVAVLLERSESHDVMLTHDMLSVLPQGELAERVRLEQATFSPAQVRVSGPRARVEAFRSREGKGKLFAVDLSGFAGSDRSEATQQIRVVEEFSDLRIEPSRVTVSMPLDPRFETFEINAPVWVDTLTRANVDLSHYEIEQTKLIRIRASNQLAGQLSRYSQKQRDDWARSAVRLFTEIPAGWDGTATLLPATPLIVLPGLRRGKDYRFEHDIEHVSIKART